MSEKDYSTRPLLDKLGVKDTSRVNATQIDDEQFSRELANRTPLIGATVECDVVFLLANDPAQLLEIAKLKPMLAQAGGLWVIYPKGKKHITEKQVMGAGLGAGLVDNKVVAFSTTHTAMRFVIRKADRR